MPGDGSPAHCRLYAKLCRGTVFRLIVGYMQKPAPDWRGFLVVGMEGKFLLSSALMEEKPRETGLGDGTTGGARAGRRGARPCLLCGRFSGTSRGSDGSRALFVPENRPLSQKSFILCCSFYSPSCRLVFSPGLRMPLSDRFLPFLFRSF